MLIESSTVPHAETTPLPVIDCTLPFRDQEAVALVERDGWRYLLGVPYGSAGHSLLVIVSLQDGDIRSLPLADAGAVVVAGADGCGYLATKSGRLLRVQLPDGELEELCWPLTGTTVRCAISHSSGYLYFGAVDGRIAEYEPRSGVVNLLPTAESGAVEALAVLADGRVAAFIRDERDSFVLLITPGSGANTRITLPAEIGGQPIAQVAGLGDGLLVSLAPDGRMWRLSLAPLQLTEMPCLPDGGRAACLRQVGGAVLASGAMSGTLYRWAGTDWEALGVPMPLDPLFFAAAPSIVGVTNHGRLVQSADGHRFTLSAATVRVPGGLAIQALCLGPDRLLYFASRGSTRLGRWDPESGRAVELPAASPYPGEVRALGMAGERLYLGFGDPCGVMRYYPELPYRLLENPHLVGLAGEDQLRPASAMILLHGELYFTSCATRETASDALVRIHPAEDQLHVYRDLLPDHRLTSLAADRLNALLIAGGRQSGEDAPAQVVCWSADEERVVARITPFPDARETMVWVAENGRVYVTDGGERLAIIAAATGELLECGDFPLGAITSLITTMRGELYGLAGGWLFRYDPDGNVIERLATASGQCLTAVRHGLFVYADAGQLFAVRLR